MEKRFLRFPTVKRTALSAETYVSHMKNVGSGAGNVEQAKETAENRI